MPKSAPTRTVAIIGTRARNAANSGLPASLANAAVSVGNRASPTCPVSPYTFSPIARNRSGRAAATLLHIPCGRFC